MAVLAPQLCGYIYMHDLREQMAISPRVEPGPGGRMLKKRHVRMRIGIPSGLASGRICTALLLLVVVPIALANPGGDVAFSQSNTGNLAQVPLYTAIDLNPPGLPILKLLASPMGSRWGMELVRPQGTSPTRCCGAAVPTALSTSIPRGLPLLKLSAPAADNRWGARSGPATRNAIHALLWRGRAGSVVDLHTFLPSGFTYSQASHIDATGDIVGSASIAPLAPGAEYSTSSHAFLWRRKLPTPGTSREQNTTRC